ncbi:hypothetical protein HY604_02645 [Candidatus Peregrinibacteria bacterium]|nr:hypothetical protein [Candidatus Peregrinibacteria bacterium]
MGEEYRHGNSAPLNFYPRGYFLHVTKNSAVKRDMKNWPHRLRENFAMRSADGGETRHGTRTWKSRFARFLAAGYFLNFRVAGKGYFWYNVLINLFDQTKMKKKNSSLFGNYGRNSGKNAHLFGPTSVQFFAQSNGISEARLLHQQPAPPDGTERPCATPEALSPGRKNAVEMIKQVHDFKTRSGIDMSDIPGSENPEDILKDNPFQHYLYERMQSSDVVGGNFNIIGAKDDPAKGEFTIEFSPGSAPLFLKIEKEAYVALMWKRIGPAVKERFARQITDPAKLNDVIFKAVEMKKPKFMAMVKAMVKAMAAAADPGTVDAQLVTGALIELQALAKDALPRLKTTADTRKELGEVKEEVDQFDQINQIREAMNHLKTNLQKNNVYLKMSIVGRSQEIDPKQRWKLSSDADIEKIKKDWQDMGIYEQAGPALMDNVIFENLKRAYDKNFIEQQPGYKQKIYNDPLNNLDKLGELNAPVFAMAIEFFNEIKKIAEEHDEYRKNYTKTNQEYGEEPITATLGKALRDNGQAFMDALHNKDWTTAGAYVLGVWAMYRAYKSLPEAKQSQYSTWAFRGAALYAAHIFAKNAGYNVLEKLGIKDLGYELAGTSLDVLYELLPELKNVKPKVINATAMTNIGDLYKRYKETNVGEKRQWIDPAKFQLEFPEFKRMRVNDAFKDGTLSGKEKDYKDTGHQLYLLVHGLEDAYNRVFKPHETENLPFEKAVLEHPIFSKSTILDFTIALRNYNPDTKESSKLLGTYETGKLRERLHFMFVGQDMGKPNVETGMSKTGVIFGTIMGFPVVFVRGKAHMFVVPKHLYEEGKGSFAELDPKLLGKFSIGDVEAEKPDAPVAPSAVAEMQKMRQKLIVDIENRMEIFRNNGGILENAHWDNTQGQWMAMLSFKRMLPGGAIERPIEVYVTPGDDGKGLVMMPTDTSQKSFLVYIENVTDATDVLGSIFMGELVRQRSMGPGITDFGALSWFLHNKELKFLDRNPNDDIFEIKIGNNVVINRKEYIRIKQRTNGIFEFADPGTEAELLKNTNFQRGLANAVANVEFASLLKRWESQIDATPEDYLFNFMKLFPNIFEKGTWDYMTAGFEAKFVTGSVPKKFTMALVKAQVAAIRAKFMIGIGNSTSMGDVDALRSAIVMPGRDGMESALSKLTDLNGKNEEERKKFSEAEFAQIWDEIINIGHNSKDYKAWYRTFMDKVFAFYGIDDFSDLDAMNAAKLLEVFSSYTAAADKSDIDGANLNFHLRVTSAMKSNLDIIFDLDRKLKRTAIYSDLPVGSTMTADDFVAARALMPEYEKMQKYNMYAQYCGAQVAGKILARVREMGKSWNPDGPNGQWNITGFEAWCKNWTSSGLHGPNELVDSTPPLRMSSDYVTIDKWLEMSEQDRKNVKKENVILPRTKAKLVFKDRPGLTIKEQMELYNELIQAYESNNTQRTMTELEAALMSKLTEVRDKIAKEYGGKDPDEPEVKPEFVDLMNSLFGFQLDYTNSATKGVDPFTITRTNKGSGKITEAKAELNINYDPSKKNRFAELVEEIEKYYAHNARIVTGTEQKAMINTVVRAFFIEHVLKNEGTLATYFNKVPLSEKFFEWCSSVKVTLFGF